MTDENERPSDQVRDRDVRTGQAAAAARMQRKEQWVEEQLRVAMERGDFDDLPGAGKPIEGLGETHDPDWWLKQLVEREKIAVLPFTVQLRKEDAELDDRLDEIAFEAEVRRVLTDFNERVVAARYRAPEGPPLVTMPRDVDAEVVAWAERRAARRAERAAAAPAVEQRPRRWWRRRRRT
jgi:hypothetical protein